MSAAERRRPPRPKARGRLGGANATSLDDGEHTAPVSPLAGAEWTPQHQAPAETVTGVVVPAEVEGLNKFVEASPALPIEAALSRGETPTLEDCERQIAVVSHQWVIGTGEALQRIHEGELWKKSTDVIYDSWTAYLRHRWDWTPQRAHQLMKAVRSAKAVAPVADSEIKEGHTRVLDRIFDELSDDEKASQACREVWLAAAKVRRPSAAALERVAIEKGYLPGQSQPDNDPPPPPPAPVSPVLVRYQRAVSAFEDLRGLRQVAAEEPAAARAIADTLRTALAELEADLPKDEEPAEE